MRIKDFLSALDSVVPLACIGYEKDAVGLQIGYRKDETLEGVLIAYEITHEVIDEAIESGANLIIAYHPLIFPSINSITDSTRTGALLRRLICANISLYILHTALDTHPEFGTSVLMASALGLKNKRALAPLAGLLEKIVVYVPDEVDTINSVRTAMWSAGAGKISDYDECSFVMDGFGTFRGNQKTNPTIGVSEVRETVKEVRIEMIVERWKSNAVIAAMKKVHPYEEVAYDRQPLLNTHPQYGMGTIGELPSPLSSSALLSLIAEKFETSMLRSSKSISTITTVALVGGSGSSYYSASRSSGATAFITADIHYHDFYRAEHDNLLLVDAGHSETERFVVVGMQNAVFRVCNVVNLQDEDRNRLIIRSRVRPNAVEYHLYKG